MIALKECKIESLASNLTVNCLESNHSEFAKIILESNRNPMNCESNRFAVYPKIHRPRLHISYYVSDSLYWLHGLTSTGNSALANATNDTANTQRLLLAFSFLLHFTP